MPPEINLQSYGLSTDSIEEFDIEGMLGSGQSKTTIPQLVNTLESIYCGPIAAEFDHLQVHYISDSCVLLLSRSDIVTVTNQYHRLLVSFKFHSPMMKVASAGQITVSISCHSFYGKLKKNVHKQSNHPLCLAVYLSTYHVHLLKICAQDFYATNFL